MGPCERRKAAGTLTPWPHRWIYKYYQPEVPEEDRTWPKRQALMRSKLLGPDGKSGADVICIQEACADSFEDDFAFMSEAGYAHLLHTKFRLRVATFWNTARVALAEEGAHKSLDRTLCAALRLTGRPDASPVYVANAHLTGGPNPDKRLRQAHDALEWIRKDAAKRAGAAGKGGKDGAPAAPAAPAVFFCGDLNDEGASAVRVPPPSY
jgi:endonuclease/exonuclease/phosphatase family metal-dependent hydrolase